MSQNYYLAELKGKAKRPSPVEVVNDYHREVIPAIAHSFTNQKYLDCKFLGNF